MPNHVLGGELHCGSTMWCYGPDDFSMWRSQQTTSNGVPGTYNHFRAACYDAVFLFSEILKVFLLFSACWGTWTGWDTKPYSILGPWFRNTPQVSLKFSHFCSTEDVLWCFLSLLIRILAISGLSNYCFLPLSFLERALIFLYLSLHNSVF